MKIVIYSTEMSRREYASSTDALSLISRKSECAVLVVAGLDFGALEAVEGDLQAEAAVGAGRRGHVTVTRTVHLGRNLIIMPR